MGIRAHFSKQPTWLRGSSTSRFASGAFWSLIGTLVTQSMTMLAAILVARLLGQEQFGELEMLNSTVATFGTFAGMGLGLTANKFVAEYKTRDPERAGRILGLSTLAAVLTGGVVAIMVFIAAPWLAANTLNAPHLSTALQVSCALFFLNALNGVQVGTLSGLEAFRRLAKVNVIRGLFTFPIVILCVWWFGLLGAVSASVILGALSWVLYDNAIRSECKAVGIKPTARHTRKEWPILWRFSFPAFLSGIVVTPFIWLANTLLANQEGGYSQLGLLNATNQWKNVLWLLPTVLAPVTLAMASSLRSDQGQDSSYKIMDLSQGTTVLLVVPAATLLMCLATSILAIYGATFVQGQTIFVLMIYGVALAAVENTAGIAVQSASKMWLAMCMNLVWGITYLATSWLLVGQYGAVALGIGFALGYFILGVPGHYLLYRLGLIPSSMLMRVAGVTGLLTALAAMMIVISSSTALWLAIPATALCLLICVVFWTPATVKSRLIAESKNMLLRKRISTTP